MRLNHKHHTLKYSMARLPVPGSDNNTWGNILNDFLGVEHNADGTLKASGSLANKADVSALATTVKQGDLLVNVKDYGAIGNGTANDTAAVVAALAAAANRTLYFPKGTYKVDPDALVASSPCRIVGENYISTIIISSGSGGAGIKITATNVEVSNLYIRGYYAGIENHTYWTKIYDNKLSFNTVGVDFYESSYIVKCRGNEITFNNVGILIRAAAEAYELVISQNIIDNNNGVGIASCSSSSGLVVENNTIEGNRNFTSNIGCGMLLREANSSRLKITGNWFEANGTDTTSAVDIFMLGVNNSTTTGALRTAIVAILPSDLQSLFTTGGMGVGAVTIAENGFIFTKYNIVCAGDKSSISIKRNTFKGVKDKLNKHVFLGTPAGTYGLGGTRINIDDNNYRNSDDPTIDPQVTTGIDSSIVYCDQAFNASATDQYFYNGVNLAISSGGKPQYIEVAGTTGAPNPGRFVGVTASSAPSTGTYRVGDFVVTQSGAGPIYVCTVAGTPGTWVGLSLIHI